MAWLVVNRVNEELVFNECPTYDRVEDIWKIPNEREELVYDDNYDYSAGSHWETVEDADYGVKLPKGTIKKIIGRTLSFRDNPLEIKEE